MFGRSIFFPNAYCAAVKGSTQLSVNILQFTKIAMKNSKKKLPSHKVTYTTFFRERLYSVTAPVLMRGCPDRKSRNSEFRVCHREQQYCYTSYKFRHGLYQQDCESHDGSDDSAIALGCSAKRPTSQWHAPLEINSALNLHTLSICLVASPKTEKNRREYSLFCKSL